VSAAAVAGMGSGLGWPKVIDFQKAGIKVGLSLDSMPFAGAADFFALMKITRLAENVVHNDGYALPYRDLLRTATVEGAQSLGLGDRTGSLAPGNRADLIMIDTRSLNLSPFGLVDHMIVDAVQPSNVDTVVVDGRILKRHGRLTSIDVEGLIDAATAASEDLLSHGKWELGEQHINCLELQRLTAGEAP
jgi:cytosine/adenosine deaminase-related metal-dependent hydrolase